MPSFTQTNVPTTARNLTATQGEVIKDDGSNRWGFYDTDGTTELFAWGPAGLIRFKNIATPTISSGMPAIMGTYANFNLTSAVTNGINYTPPAAAGLYRVTASLDITAWVTPSAGITCVITYKDKEANARTDTMALTRDTGALATTGLAVAVDRWHAIPVCIYVDNSATPITFSTGGTFTGSPTYDAVAFLEYMGTS